MSNEGFGTDDIAALRRATRDIVAISSLPSIWIRHSPSQVVDSLVETVFRNLGLEFAYVILVDGDKRIETAYTKCGFLTEKGLDRLRSQFEAAFATRSSVGSLGAMPNPAGNGYVNVYSTSFGPISKNGCLVVGAKRSPFPVDTERLVLNIATNLSHVTVQHKWAHAEAEKHRVRAEESEAMVRIAHAAAERERQKLQSVFESSPSFLAVLRGPDFVVENANAQYLDLVGRQDVIGKKLIEALPEISSQKYLDILTEVLRTGKTFIGSEMAVELARSPGAALEKRYVDLVYQRISDDSSHDSIFAHGVDVTDKVHARRETERSKETYRVLFEKNPLPMWIFDPISLDFVDVNGTAVRHYGFSKEEFLAMNLGEILVAEKGADSELGPTKSSEARRLCSHSQQRHRKKDGSHINVEVSAHDLDIYGKTLRIAVVMDVTKRQEIETKQQELLARLTAAKQEAEHANKLKSAFLANMSHEIRTPLGVMIGFTELILDPDTTMEDRALYSNVMKRNGEQLLALINDILDLSKVESGFLKVENVGFSLTSLIAETMESFRLEAQAKGIQLLVRSFDDGADSVISDPLRLKQILMNLVSNAVKFTERGEIQLVVEVEGDRIAFEVQDTGIGMSPAEQERLFKPFTQADESTTRKFGGTGLGLALSKKLAELLGGDLILKSSEPSRGSTFLLTVANRTRVAEPCDPSSHKYKENTFSNLH